jgi:hypothetical protein
MFDETDKESVFLLPTHASKYNVITTAKALGKEIPNIYVISNFLTNYRSEREQIFSLSRF